MNKDNKRFLALILVAILVAFLTIIVFLRLEIILRIFGAAVVIYWLYNDFKFVKYVQKKYPKMMRSKSLKEYLLHSGKGKDSFFMLKEVCKPSHKSDQAYMEYIRRFWTSLFVFIISLVVYLSSFR